MNAFLETFGVHPMMQYAPPSCIGTTQSDISPAGFFHTISMDTELSEAHVTLYERERGGGKCSHFDITFLEKKIFFL